jgi:hypothetical protein
VRKIAHGESGTEAEFGSAIVHQLVTTDEITEILHGFGCESIAFEISRAKCRNLSSKKTLGNRVFFLILKARLD